MASTPLAPASPRGGWAEPLARAGARLLRTLYVGTALLGLLVTPPLVVLVVVPVLTVTAVVLLAGFLWYIEDRWPTRSTLTTTAVVTAALIPFGQAVQALQSVGTAVGLVVVGLLIVLGMRWLSGQAAQAGRAATLAREVGGTESLRDLLQVMPMETLLAEWRTLHEAPGDRLPAPEAVATRSLLLDEMQRRDPDGFATWLDAGASGPPDEHVRDDGGLPA